MQSPKRSIKSPDSGAITIYLSLVFTLIISMFLTVITVARGSVIQVVFECAVENALCSAFGEYNQVLLNDYDLLFIDLSYLSNSPDINNLERKLNENLYDNLHPEADEKILFVSDMVDIKGANASIEEYSLATDYGGQAFIEQASSCMKNLVGLEDVEGILSKITVCNSYEFSSEKYEETKERELSILKVNDDDGWEQTRIKEKLMSWGVIDAPLMILIGNDCIKLSGENINIWDTLLFRNKHTGNSGINIEDTIENIDPLKNVYFSEYILSSLGCYTKQKEESKLKYEIEYVIGGYASDYANMQVVVTEIYAIRVLADYIALNSAENKVATVREITGALSAVLEVPEPLLTQAVLFLWASLEGITDTQALCKGEKVSFIKKSDEINISLEGFVEMIGGAVSSQTETKEVNEDFDNIQLKYEDYLRIFLYIMPTTFKAYRVMDMIEHDIRKNYPENQYFRFDSCTDSVKVSFSLESGYDYRFITEKKYSFF